MKNSIIDERRFERAPRHRMSFSRKKSFRAHASIGWKSAEAITFLADNCLPLAAKQCGEEKKFPLAHRGARVKKIRRIRARSHTSKPVNEKEFVSGRGQKYLCKKNSSILMIGTWQRERWMKGKVIQISCQGRVEAPALMMFSWEISGIFCRFVRFHDRKPCKSREDIKEAKTRDCEVFARERPCGEEKWDRQSVIQGERIRGEFCEDDEWWGVGSLRCEKILAGN